MTHKHHRRKRRFHIFKSTAAIIFSALFLCAGAFTLWLSSFRMPDLNDIEQQKISESTKIYDRTGKVLLYDVHNNVRRTVVPLEKMSRNIRNASVAIEDAEFYSHGGIRLSSIIRAVIADVLIKLHLQSGYTQGGSTITQQVIKNTVLTTEKSLTRKLKEWVLAEKLETILNKDAILALYLNSAPYGGTVYGIEEASQIYFGKSAADLSIAEAAYMAALPNSPTYYSPYGNNRAKLEDRKNLVLAKMLEKNFITNDEYKTSLAEKVTFLPQQNTGILAPHFVLFIKQYLEDKYGADVVENGGLKVITTLDYTLQAKGEEIIKAGALQNKKNFNAENASLVAVDPKTGQILVMVGSRDYFDKEIDGNFNIALAHRQPGSSFKPFVYATAFEKGYTPDTMLFDAKTEFSTFCNPDGTPINPADEDKCYEPENFDGKYLGPLSIRNALAQSRNIPAIQTLYLSGLRDSLQTAKDMGITTLASPNQYGLTLVLGGGEVSLLEMTNAYATFANKGTRNPYTGIIEVDDREGNALEKFEPHPIETLPKDISLEITDILSDNKARAPEFGEDSALNFPGRDVADKTGTTNDYRDAWIIGYTPSIAVGAWAGNNDNSPMEKKIAGFIIAPIWHQFMVTALASLPAQDRFEKPEDKDKSGLKPVLRGVWQGNKTYIIDRISGKLATDQTPQETRVEKVVSTPHSILYWVDKNNPLGPPPEHPENDPQFQSWEYAVSRWLSEQGTFIPQETDAVIPTATDDVHVPGSAPQISILGVQDGVYEQNERVFVSVSSQGRYPLARTDFFLNDKLIGSSTNAPFGISFVPSNQANTEPTNILKVVGRDTAYNKAEASLVLRLNFGN